MPVRPDRGARFVTAPESDPPGVVPVVAAVIRRAERALVALRPAGKRYAGSWEFPGGKLAPGESQHTAMARELQEELGVRLARIGERRFSVRDPGAPFVIHFLDVSVIGRPRALEHDELRWVTRDEALRLPLAPSDRRFVEEGW